MQMPRYNRLVLSSYVCISAKLYKHRMTCRVAFAICYVILMWLVGYIMDKRKIYIKV